MACTLRCLVVFSFLEREIQIHLAAITKTIFFAISGMAGGRDNYSLFVFNGKGVSSAINFNFFFKEF